MQPLAFKPQFGAIILADGCDADGNPLALVALDEHTLTLDAALALLADGPFAAKHLVLGAEASAIRSSVNCEGWEILSISEEQSDPLAATRLAMQSLPLLDGFFLIDLGAMASESLPLADQSDLLQRMISNYMRERLNLMRVVVPVIGGRRAFPWLIDIGFRQPFIEREADAPLTAVLEASASQVLEMACEEHSD